MVLVFIIFYWSVPSCRIISLRCVNLVYVCTSHLTLMLRKVFFLDPHSIRKENLAKFQVLFWFWSWNSAQPSCFWLFQLDDSKSWLGKWLLHKTSLEKRLFRVPGLGNDWQDPETFSIISPWWFCEKNKKHLSCWFLSPPGTLNNQFLNE